MEVVPLSKVRKEDALLCGNKGAQIGEVAYAGLPVPDGFVVTTEAFVKYMEKGGLGEQIREALSDVNPVVHPDLSFIADEIKGWAMQINMDESLKKELDENFDKLGVTYVAVRSSPVIVEAVGVPMAGLLPTAMDVTRVNLHENVERVWTSLYSSRGLEYLFSERLIGKHVLVAVVVQVVVDSQVSGVMYCGKPGDLTSECLIVEAGWGLGETMVSGIVTPDRYVVNIEERQVAESFVGKQMKEYVRVGEKLSFVNIPEARMNAKKLKEEEILELAGMYKKIYEHYEAPQKVEWCYSNGKFYILQTGPMSPS